MTWHPKRMLFNVSLPIERGLRGQGPHLRFSCQSNQLCNFSCLLLLLRATENPDFLLTQFVTKMGIEVQTRLFFVSLQFQCCLYRLNSQKVYLCDRKQIYEWLWWSNQSDYYCLRLLNQLNMHGIVVVVKSFVRGNLIMVFEEAQQLVVLVFTLSSVLLIFQLLKNEFFTLSFVFLLQ